MKKTTKEKPDIEEKCAGFLLFQEEIKKELEKLIKHLLPSYPLKDLLKYSILQGGKRFRPLLLLTVVAAYQKNWKEALYPAAAIEFIHCYSLIHDDLPCMDNDDYRRGIPTLHKAFGEWKALLTGDALLTQSFDVIANCPFLDDAKKVKIISLFAKKSGADGMIKGQYLDLFHKTSDCNSAVLAEIHKRKTADLITASLLAGAEIVEASPEEKKILESFGLHLGLAFQLHDDWMDYVDSQNKHGSSIPSDMRNQTVTSVSLFGLKDTKTLADKELKNAYATLKSLSVQTDLFEQLIYFFFKK